MGGVAVDSKSSPRRSAIEKAQEDLRQEYDVREARRRELEFLEKGGNPLDFKLEKVASLSVQSTSLNITSEAKESYAPHGGDSVESSGPNMADNISLLDGDNSNAGSQIIIKTNNSGGGTVGTKDEEPGILRFARRNRTRSNVGTRSGTVGIVGSTKVDKEKEKEKEKEEVKEVEKEKDELIVVSDSVPVNEDTKEDDVKVVSETVLEPETGTIETVEKTKETCTGMGTGTVVEGTSEMEIDIVNAGTKGEIGITGTGTGTVTDGLTENVGTGTEQKDELKDKEKEFDQPVPVQVDQVEKSKGEEKDKKEEKDEKKVEKSKTELNDVEMQDVTEIEKSKELETTVSENTVVPPTEEELKAQKKEYEDSVLKQAKIIEANRKKACEIPSSKLPLEKRRKCHWDFVLEEMAWLANDFMQERLWKISAANQASNWAKGGISKFEELNLIKKQKNIARVLSKSVIKFWHSVDEERKQGVKKEENNSDLKKGPIGIKSYAIRVLEMNKSSLIEPPKTPERNRQPGSIIVLEQISSERLFYTVPAGAIQAYRESIESQYARAKKNGNNTTNFEDYETSNSIADTRMENAYEEDEVQTSSYKYKNNNTNIKKRKHGRLQDPSPHSPLSLSKRQVSNSNSPNILRIPTKRVRTNIQTGRKIPVLKTEVSSDNNSAERERDREGLLRECESFNNNSNKRGLLDDDVMPAQQRRFDDELAIKSKKKKKQKVFGDGGFGNNNEINVGPSSKNSMYEHGSSRGQADNLMHHDQKDHVKKRMETHHFDSNSNNISYGQPGMRKPKMLNATSAIQETGPTLMSPMTSSQNNMSNPKQLIKFVNSNRDRANIARKGKGIKLVGGNSGSGSTWSSFEDQALVVLVHDLGPHWELISDMINNTLHFKCVYKRSKECKERHKFLMDKNSDGADSAEDSGTSSQPYPSTLPGIPKGSARQLFQRLQGPLEEDTLKSHFEKIISISHKIRPKNSQELKQIQPAHNSHVVALSQVQPNNLSGIILTPLDLCDMAGPVQQEMSLTGQIGYPPNNNNNNNNNGLSSLPGPQSNMGGPVMPPHSSPSFSSASTTPSQQRFGGVPRGPPDYNNHPGLALPARSVVPLAGGSGPGSPNVRVVGNGSGLIRGMSPRPGFQRLNPMNMASGSAVRPQMLRPVQNMDEQQHNRLLIDHHHLQLQQQNVNPTIQSQSATSSSPLNSPAHHLLSNHPSPHQHPSFRFSKQIPQQRMVSPGQQQSLMMSAQQQSVVGTGQVNLPEGSGMGFKKQKMNNTQMRQSGSGSSSNNSIAQKGGGMKGGRILIHQTLAATQQPVSSNINNNNNVSNKMYGPVSSSSGMGVNRIGAPAQQAVDQQISDSGGGINNSNNQEGISGNEMLIGQRHWNNNNNNQQGNNNNSNINRGGVYPSNSGAG